MSLETSMVVDGEAAQQLCFAVHKSNRILMSSHRVAALEERFKQRYDMLRLDGCGLICCNVTAIVDCILCGIAFVKEQSASIC